jgi:NAD(P)-dependent dehydrogenase (short-subunit alcohol dehydrogenase family)
MGQWSNGAGQRRLRHVRLTRKDMGMKKIIVITGASSGFGALAARALARAGHIVYAGMRETAGRTKAGMDAIAVIYARELSRWGIESSIIVPGAFTGGTNHFAHAGSPADKARVAEYEAGPYAGFADQVQKAFSAIVPANANASAVADAIAQVVDMPFGQRPFRVYVDPTHDGAELTFRVMDHVRAEMLHRVGLADLLVPAAPPVQTGAANAAP